MRRGLARLSWRLLALRLLVALGGRLPAPLLARLADRAGGVAWYASARLRRTTRDHMRHVLSGGGSPAVDRAARGVVRSAARYYADFARGARDSPGDAIAELSEVQGIEHFFAPGDRGCGMIVVSAHLGNPEFLAGAMGAIGIDLLVLTERLQPPAVHDFVHAVRAAPGVRFVPADRGGVRAALTHLRGGGALAVLGDRDLDGSGLPVPFFGERARLPAGPVELALRTGVPLVPAFVLRDGPDRYRAVVRPALELPRSGDRAADVRAGVALMAQALEQGIRMAPDQWFPLQPVWSGLAS